MKKLLILLTALLLPMVASAGAVEVDGIYYNLNTGAKTAEVTSNPKYYRGDVTIPKTFEYGGTAYSVTSIGESAFEDCSNLTSITIPNSVKNIGINAFRDCSGLTSITIPNSVTKIGIQAFRRCSGLTSITIPNSVTSIGNTAFDRCSSLTSITLPDGLTTIKFNVFSYCSGLTSVTIPNSVTSIEDGVFYGCSSLTSITIPKNVLSIGSQAFDACSGLTSVTVKNPVPIYIEGSVFTNQSNATLCVPHGCKDAYKASAYWKGFKEIVEPISFADAKVKELCVANWDSNNDDELTEAEAAAVTVLGEVFKGKEIKSFDELKYFKGLTDIGVYAFKDCSGLTSITIPNSVTNIGDYAFYGCSGLTSITIPNSVTFIGKGAFVVCSGLNSITIPNSVTSIGESAFASCSGLTSITIPNSVTNIERNAFYNCSGLTSINIPNSVSSIGDYAFYGCSGLILITIPNSVTSIGESAFYNCSSLTAITIPNSVTSIEKNAFYNCSSLTAITIPNSVTSIGDGAFRGTGWYKNQCNGLLYLDNWLLGYKGDKPTGEITIADGTKGIAGCAFYYCSGLTTVSIPNGVASIGQSAFSGCSALTSVTVENPAPVSITSYVFTNCSNATLYVPHGCKAAYQAADYWKDFKEIIEMELEFEPGDLNGDGSINGVDLVAQTNLIMTDQYNAAADLNNDGVVNGLDYVMMVNLIMSFTSSPTMEDPASNRAASTANLSVEDFDIKAGETKEMFINLSNPDNELTLLQFDMRLPEGLSIATEDGDDAIDIAGRTTWKRHSLMAKAIDGATRFLLASNTNALIDGDNGNVISIKLTASDDFKSGDIKLENQLLVSPDAKDMMPADYNYAVGGATSIDAITTGESVDVYTLTGTKVRHQATSLDGLPKGVYVIKGKKVIVK